MYGDNKIQSPNLLRSKMIKKMVGDDLTLTSKSKMDLARLPPCLNNLLPHIKAYIVNHRLAFYKQADEPFMEAPNPFDCKQGWLKNQNNVLEPSWQGGPILP